MVDLSDTPRGAISRLEDAISRRGETVTFQSQTAGVMEVTVKAFVRFTESSDLVGAVQQTLRNIVISPTGFEAWPDGHPVEDDWCVMAGWECSIQAAKPKRMADTLVRIELMVKG